MSERLAKRELAFCEKLAPSDRAKRIAPKLGEVAEELSSQAVVAKDDANREILELFAAEVDIARDLLRVLEQEQWRQREAIKLYLHGRIGRRELREISDSWNGARTALAEARDA